MFKQYNAGIIGMGAYVPENVRKNDFWDEVKIVGYDKELSNLFTNIEERRVFPENMLSSEAELIAAERAINDAKLSANDVELVIVNSMLPDYISPGNATLIQQKLGLKNSGAWNIDTFCSSFVTMVIIASNLVMTGAYKNIIIVASSYYSQMLPITHYLSPITGDGVGAAVIGRVSPERGFINSYCSSNGEYHDSFTVTCSEDMRFKRKINIIDEELKRSTKNEVHAMVSCVKEIMSKSNLQIADIDMIITHQPFHWMPDAWIEALDMPKTKIYLTYSKYGNLAAASVPINLIEASRFSKIKDEHLVLLYSPGAGMNHSAALLRWGK